MRLHEQLVARRAELLQALSDELQDLRHEIGGRSGRDDVDLASDSVTDEMTSQLAQMESEELRQIDRALVRLRNGTYGTCEMCAKKIPVARLNALPYAAYCILCRRKIDENPEIVESSDEGWQKVYESEVSAQDVSVNLSDLEYNLG